MRNWKNPKSNLEKWYELINTVYFKPTEPSILICPECSKNTMHYFWWRASYDDRGANWIWCSSCLNFFHHSAKVPKWWENIEDVPYDHLMPEPEWLESNLDKWETVMLNFIRN